MQEITTINSMEQIYNRILTVLPRYTETPQFSKFKCHITHLTTPAECSYDFTTDTATLKITTPIADANTLAKKYPFVTTGIRIKNNVVKIQRISQYSIKVEFNAPIIKQNNATNINEAIGNVILQGITTASFLNKTYILEKNSNLLDKKTAILTLKDISYGAELPDFADITNEGFTMHEFDFAFNGLQKNSVSITANTFQFKTGKTISQGYVIDFANAKLLVCNGYTKHSQTAILDNVITENTVSIQFFPSPNFLQTSRNENNMVTDAIETIQQENGGKPIMAQNIVRYIMAVGLKYISVDGNAGGGFLIDEFHNLSLLIQREIAGLIIKFTNDDFYTEKSRLALNNSPQFNNDIKSHYVALYEFAFSYGKMLVDWCYNNFNDFSFEINEVNIKTSKGEEYQLNVN